MTTKPWFSDGLKQMIRSGQARVSEIDDQIIDLQKEILSIEDEKAECKAQLMSLYLASGININEKCSNSEERVIVALLVEEELDAAQMNDRMVRFLGDKYHRRTMCGILRKMHHKGMIARRGNRKVGYTYYLPDRDRILSGTQKPRSEDRENADIQGGLSPGCQAILTLIRERSEIRYQELLKHHPCPQDELEPLIRAGLITSTQTTSGLVYRCR